MEIVACFENQGKYVDDKIQEISEKLGELSIFQVHIHWIKLIFILFISWILGGVSCATIMRNIFFADLKKIFDGSPLTKDAKNVLNETEAKGTPDDELEESFDFMKNWSISLQKTKIEPLGLENEQKMALTAMKKEKHSS
ncbi:hypothetical protein Ciccas_009079 [Cichlidogyrus casuarinus]|uniref:Uncharacterized protein n=1 Tax=Cichlidogyrus casuarinus TaxID=1844966 RepID=A0ABD2PZ07_9PLAT